MPRNDGTGPMGNGPMTGWKKGACLSDNEEFSQPSSETRGRGLGNGGGSGRGRGLGNGGGSGRGRGLGNGGSLSGNAPESIAKRMGRGLGRGIGRKLGLGSRQSSEPGLGEFKDDAPKNQDDKTDPHPQKKNNSAD